jgi:tripartite-type tricarboxylate transporter receptor subunit TctC
VVIHLGNWHRWDNRSGVPTLRRYVMIGSEFAAGHSKVGDVTPMGLSKSCGALVALAAACLATTPAQAQSAADFYRGNTIKFALASEPGGGFDLVARGFAKYFVNYMPGKPNVVIVNMPGGGGTIHANWAYNIAPKDGSVINMNLSTLPMNQVIAPDPVRYDANKFNWVGNLEKATGVILTWHTSATKTMQDAMARETPMAGTGKNSIIYQLLTMSNKLLDTRFKVVLGYNTGRVLAVERGEVDGTASTLQNIPAMAPSWTEVQYNLLAVNTPERLPKYPNVPTMVEFTKTTEARQMLEFWMLQSATARAVFTQPEVPADRIAALRRAFDQTVKDPGFLAEMEKLQTVVEPDSGEEVQEAVRQLIGTSPTIANMVLEIIK